MPAARTTDPTTSREAAKIDPADLDALRQAILKKFKRRPRTGWTDNELVDAITDAGIWRAPQRIRTARNELRKLGLLRDTDETRLTPSGYKATVRVLA